MRTDVSDNRVVLAVIRYNFFVVLMMVCIIGVSIALTGQFYGLWALLMLFALASAKHKPDKDDDE